VPADKPPPPKRGPIQYSAPPSRDPRSDWKEAEAGWDALKRKSGATPPEKSGTEILQARNDLGGDIADAIEQSERSAEQATVSHGTPNDRTLVTFLDYSGLGAILFAIEEMGRRWFEELPITQHHWVAFGVFMVAGAIALGLARRVKNLRANAKPLRGRLSASFDAVAHSAITWLVTAAILIFGIPLTFWAISPPPQIHAASSSTTPRSINPAAAEISTTIRLQFSAEGKAEEIEKKNITGWRVIALDGPGTLVSAPLFLNCSDGSQPFGKTSGLSTIVPSGGYCLEKTRTSLIVLTFDKPILFKKLKLNAHGASLRDWDNDATESTFAVILVHGELKNLVLDITLVN
jgi:hypothetical protein